MTLARTLCLLVLLVLGLTVHGWAAPARAAEPSPQALAAAAARGPCLASKDVMRRTHMDLLKDERDRVVRLGLRQPGRTLEQCVSCHVTPGADGRPVTIADDSHFCAACHRQAAVSIDCFSCHRSTPDDKVGIDIFQNVLPAGEQAGQSVGIPKPYCRQTVAHRRRRHSRVLLRRE